jgi:hypothetical protein
MVNNTINEPIDDAVSFCYELFDTLFYNCKYNIRDDARTCNIIVKQYKIEEIMTLTVEKKSDLLNAGRDAAVKFIQSLAI